jgi:hypothetical protein
MLYVQKGASKKARLALLFNEAHSSAKCQLTAFLYAVLSLESRVDKIPGFLVALTENENLWNSLRGGMAGALEDAMAAAGAAGLNAEALRNKFSGTGGSAGKFMVRPHAFQGEADAVSKS